MRCVVRRVRFRLAEDPVRLPFGGWMAWSSAPACPSTRQWCWLQRNRGIPMVGELELGLVAPAGRGAGHLRHKRQKPPPLRCLAKSLKNAGRVTHVAGNIGYPLSAVAMKSKKDDVVVVEVSSFQLESIKTFHPHVAASAQYHRGTISTAMAPWRSISV